VSGKVEAMNAWEKQTGIHGKSDNLPKPVRPKTASAVLRRRKGETVTLVTARKTRKPVKRFK
jgi:hypothetical protein